MATANSLVKTGRLFLGDNRKRMSRLSSLRTAWQDAFMVLEAELSKLQPLTEMMQRTGTTPPDWAAQNDVAKAAQTEFDTAQATYLDALRQKP
jgi:hypothetical protein